MWILYVVYYLIERVALLQQTFYVRLHITTRLKRVKILILITTIVSSVRITARWVRGGNDETPATIIIRLPCLRRIKTIQITTFDVILHRYIFSFVRHLISNTIFNRKKKIIFLYIYIYGGGADAGRSLL